MVKRKLKLRKWTFLSYSNRIQETRSYLTLTLLFLQLETFQPDHEDFLNHNYYQPPVCEVYR